MSASPLRVRPREKSELAEPRTIERYRREVVALLRVGRGIPRSRGTLLVKRWDKYVRARWLQGKPPCNVADHIGKFEREKLVKPARDASRGQWRASDPISRRDASKRARRVDGIVSHDGRIWRGLPNFHRFVDKDWPRRLEARRMTYACDACLKSKHPYPRGKLWVTDTAIWHLLPRKDWPLRLCLPHFRQRITKAHAPRALVKKKALIEAHYERLKIRGKYKPINYSANRREARRS